IGTSELLDAFAALTAVDWGDRVHFREALATTLAKSPDDRRVFDLVFDRYFFRAVEAQAAAHGLGEGDGLAGAARHAGVDALRDGDEAALADLARLAIATFGRRGDGAGVVGVDVQRIRRRLGLRAEPQHRLASGDVPHDGEMWHDGIPREQLRRFEQELRRQ